MILLRSGDLSQRFKFSLWLEVPDANTLTLTFLAFQSVYLENIMLPCDVDQTHKLVRVSLRTTKITDCGTEQFSAYIIGCLCYTFSLKIFRPNGSSSPS